MTQQIIISSATIIALTILAMIVLKGWQGWLALKERELERNDRRTVDTSNGGNGGSAARIEIADLKERIRKLEAIASGVDL